jgi:hypothetical protein
MALIELHPDLTRTADALESIREALWRIMLALERLSPPIPAAPEPYQAKLSDLRRTDPATLSRVRSALEQYADNERLVVNSDAFLASVKQYEQQIAEVYGEEALLELPWNKAAGGPIFEASPVHHGGRTQEPQAATRRADAEPATGPGSEAESKSDSVSRQESQQGQR